MEFPGELLKNHTFISHRQAVYKLRTVNVVRINVLISHMQHISQIIVRTHARTVILSNLTEKGLLLLARANTECFRRNSKYFRGWQYGLFRVNKFI
jgi:hypothetical protein